MPKIQTGIKTFNMRVFLLLLFIAGLRLTEFAPLLDLPFLIRLFRCIYFSLHSTVLSSIAACNIYIRAVRHSSTSDFDVPLP